MVTQPIIAMAHALPGTANGEYARMAAGCRCQRNAAGSWSVYLDGILPLESFVAIATPASISGAPLGINVSVELSPFSSQFQTTIGVILRDKADALVDAGFFLVVSPIPDLT